MSLVAEDTLSKAVVDDVKMFVISGALPIVEKTNPPVIATVLACKLEILKLVNVLTYVLSRPIRFGVETKPIRFGVLIIPGGRVPEPPGL